MGCEQSCRDCTHNLETTEHAGIDTQKATFLDRKIYQDHTTSVLEWVARQIKDKNNVVGLQLLNEPHPDIHARYNSWCRHRTLISRSRISTDTGSSDETTLLRIRSILGDDFPFYIGGSISDQIRMDWIRQQPGFIVMDYHLVSYRQSPTIISIISLRNGCDCSSIRYSTIDTRKRLRKSRPPC